MECFEELVKAWEVRPCARTSATRLASASSLVPEGRLDRTGLAKVRHIDVNCLLLEDQCAKKLVPLVDIPGEHHIAHSMTKHPTGLIINKHVVKIMNLDLRSGRSAKAAKLHSILKKDTQMTSTDKINNVSESYVETLGNDFWAERGGYGR